MSSSNAQSFLKGILSRNIIQHFKQYFVVWPMLKHCLKSEIQMFDKQHLITAACEKRLLSCVKYSVMQHIYHYICKCHILNALHLKKHYFKPTLNFEYFVSFMQEICNNSVLYVLQPVFNQIFSLSRKRFLHCIPIICER